VAALSWPSTSRPAIRLRLGPPADLVDHGVGQLDDMEMVHHHRGVAERGDQDAGVAAPGVQRDRAHPGEPGPRTRAQPGDHGPGGAVSDDVQQPATFDVDQAGDIPGGRGRSGPTKPVSSKPRAATPCRRAGSSINGRPCSRTACNINVSDLNASNRFYRDILGLDHIIYLEPGKPQPMANGNLGDAMLMPDGSQYEGTDMDFRAVFLGIRSVPEHPSISSNGSCLATALRASQLRSTTSTPPDFGQSTSV
jgi:hypothetical protein